MTAITPINPEPEDFYELLNRSVVDYPEGGLEDGTELDLDNLDEVFDDEYFENADKHPYPHKADGDWAPL